MEKDDTELIALIDDEIDESSKRALLSRIAEDSALRARYEALREQRAAMDAALAALLFKAPVSRLKTFIPPEAPPRRATGRIGGIALRELAAGLIIGFALAAAWTALTFSRGDDGDDWRAAVVDYMDLYTNETFAHIPADTSARAQELSAVGDRVGAKLTPRRCRCRVSTSRPPSSSPTRSRRSARSCRLIRRALRSSSASSPTGGRRRR